MARSEARLQLEIWQGLDGLPPNGKLVYAVVLTEPTLNYAGACALRERRWARNAGLTLDELAEALKALRVSRHLVIDEDTDEVLVRTFIRNDGVASQPNLLKAALREARQIVSPELRRVLAAELRRLPPKPEDTAKMRYPDPHACAAELDPEGVRPDPPDGGEDVDDDLTDAIGEPIGEPNGEPISEPIGNPSGTHPSVHPNGRHPGTHPGTPGGRGRGRGSSSPDSLSSSTPVAGAPRARARTHARDPQPTERSIPLPDDWRPHAGHIRTASHRGVDLEHEFAQFVAHAHAHGRLAVDWDAAFTVWLGSARRRDPNPWTRTSRSSTDANIAALLAGHLPDQADYPPLRAIGGGA